MQSKTSLFSKTLFVKNLKRMAPLWIVYLLFLLLELPIAYVFRLSNGVRYIDAAANESAEALDYACQILHVACNPLDGIIFGFFVAVGCFAYLYRERSAYMMHAFPLSRPQIYLTNVISGLCMLWIPEILVFFISIPCFLSVSAGGVSCTGMLLVWLLYTAGTSLLFFALGVFSCMLTGNIVATPFLYGFCLVGIDAIRYLTAVFCSMFLYGADGATATVSVFSPGLKALNSIDFNNYYDETANVAGTAWYQVFDGVDSSLYTTRGEVLVIGYAIFAILLLIVNMLIYRRRKLEETGEVIAYGFLRPVFRWVIGYSFGVGLTVILMELLLYGIAQKTFAGLIILALILGLIALSAAQMILKKSPHIFEKKFLAELGVFALVMLAGFGAVAMDVTGFESKIPESEEIASVTFDCQGYIDTTDPEMIEFVRTFHMLAVIEKDEICEELKQNGNDYYTMYINYQLKNGSTLSRRYCVPSAEEDFAEESSLISQIKVFENEPAYLENYIFETDGKPISIKDGYVENIILGEEDYNCADIPLDQDEAQALYEAVMKDIEAGNMEQFAFNEEYDNYFNSISFHYTDTTASDQETQSCYINFGPESENTIAMLEKLGVLTQNDLVTEKEIEELYWNE